MSQDFQSPTPEFKRWLMFLIAPNDVINLLNWVSNPLNKFAASALPPDVHVEDAFYDEEQNYLGLMLESEYFDPVEIHQVGDRLSAAWPRALFTMPSKEEVAAMEDDLWGAPEMVEGLQPHESAPDFLEEFKGAVERGRHFRALNISGTDVLEILQTKSLRSLRVFPSYKADTRILGSIENRQIQGWTIFLEHPDFEVAKATQEEDMVFLEVEGDGHDMSFRFGLPDSRIQRQWEVLEE